MVKTGRNALCPCGSGKKYKQCCFAQDTAYQTLLREQREAKMRAAGWLMECYGNVVNDVVAVCFFQDPEGDTQERIAELPKNTQLAVLICLHEWLIADAKFPLEDYTLIRASELLLGTDGPRFSANGRRHIEDLAASTLSLYEVLEVHKGKGFLLRDLLRPGEPPVFVHEVKATEFLVSWDTLGARILRRDGKCTLGGGVYPFKREHALEVTDFLTKTIKRENKKKHPADTVDDIVTFGIIGAWLDAITAPPAPVPRLVDAETREPILFTTDRYRVSDWPALENILAAQDDVEREDENVWTWSKPINKERYRSLASLERLSADMLTVECRTKGRADTARKWLEKLAAPHISHLERTTEDPRERFQDAGRSQPKAAKRDEDEIPLEIQREIINEHLTEHYGDWPNMPLPALNGKTPLQAAKLKTYRPKLVELLKQIEQGEARRAKDSGIPAFDIGFLWERLGLVRQ